MNDYRIYLNEPAHAETWINGGLVPISPASRYKSETRQGVFTPDENRIFQSTGIPEHVFRPGPTWGALQVNAGIVTFKDCTVRTPLGETPLNGTVHARDEDGLILSISRGSVARWKQEGKQACVRLVDIARLRSVLDKAIGRQSLADEVRYTVTMQRHHFLKGREDRWQREYRFFWAVENPEVTWVELPPGIAIGSEF